LVEPIAPRCNVAWVSAVVESDGTVRPCFFHAAIGNVREQSLLEALNSPSAIDFRNSLDVANNPTCQQCVCSLYLPADFSFGHFSVNENPQGMALRHKKKQDI
jgi:radical SAM protein with 4Fe4S-binding SPASM domain